MDLYQKLIDRFYQNQNNEQALGMAAYMKNKFPFLGIPKPERQLLLRDFTNQLQKAAAIEWDFVFRLWDMPEREFQYIAVNYLLTLQKLLQSEDIAKLKLLITTKSWWDTVDSLTVNNVGALCTTYPKLVDSHLLQWAESENIWLARTAILFQLKYKQKTDPEVLSQIIRKNTGSKEFFINKAIGWMLREYSKTNKDWVKTFVETTILHPLSVREASKYL